MRLLIDTHALIWHSDASPQMSAVATALMNDPANDRLLSIGSVWEIAIKAGMKKLASEDLFSRSCRARPY